MRLGAGERPPCARFIHPRNELTDFGDRRFDLRAGPLHLRAAIREAIWRIAYEAHHLREDMAALKALGQARDRANCPFMLVASRVGFSRTFSRDWREFLSAMDASNRFGFCIAAE